MEIIKEPDLNIIKHLNSISIVNNNTESNRKSIYCIEEIENDKCLIYNTLTCELIVIDIAELQSFYQSDFAAKHYFTVNSEFDEYQSTKRIKTLLSAAKETLSKFVILTTTDCNARCYYCFEKGHQNHCYMSTETALRLADYICSRVYDPETIHLSWFGGEPLLNVNAIDIICKECSKNNKKFYSSMITNGLLFDKSIIEQASNIWNLKWVQITIDGTEQVYNKTKKYIDYIGNPFYTVLDNIELLIDQGIHVLVSLRVSELNGDSLLELVDILMDRFGKFKRFSVMCAAIHEKNAGMESRRDLASERNVRGYQKEIIKRSFQYGIYSPKLPSKFRAHHCNSDSGKEIIILPSGEIGWCNNYLDTNYIGDIRKQDLNNEKIRLFKERYPDLKECCVCPMYPQCTRLKICDGSTPWCSKEQQEVIRYSLSLAMKNEYAIFQKK